MPVMDGLDLIQSLKEENWGGVILVLSNYADFELARAALTRGANDYLLKLDIDGELLAKQLTAAAALVGEKSTLVKSSEVKDSYYACLVSAQNKTPQTELNTPAQRALAVFKQMFAETDAKIDVTGENEIFMLIPGSAHKDTYKRIMDKLSQAVRQANIYLSLDTRALLSGTVTTAEQTDETYKTLETASDLFFSPALPEVICLEDALYTNLPEKFESFRKEVREAILFVHFNYQNTITLDDIAKAVNLNKDYLCRLFKKETGFQMFRYLSNLRMQRAAMLISKNPDRSYVRDVAVAVGIDDQFYFTRVFKKYHGVSPSEYSLVSRAGGKDAKK